MASSLPRAAYARTCENPGGQREPSRAAYVPVVVLWVAGRCGSVLERRGDWLLQRGQLGTGAPFD